MELTPDAYVYWKSGIFELNATLVFTLVIDVLLIVGSALITRRLSTELSASRWQTMLEVVVSTIRDQLQQITGDDPRPYLPFIGTLFLFIAISNALVVFPYYQPPTGSLSTTSALALCVFVAVPYFGIRDEGLLGYLKRYIQPSPLMLPFNIIGEISRTVALAIRLFGNIMSGSLIVALIVALAPFFFPVLVNLLGLLTGVIQAYIFAVLAAVFIASGAKAHRPLKQSPSGVVT